MTHQLFSSWVSLPLFHLRVKTIFDYWQQIILGNKRKLKLKLQLINVKKICMEREGKKNQFILSYVWKVGKEGASQCSSLDRLKENVENQTEISNQRDMLSTDCF